MNTIRAAFAATAIVALALVGCSGTTPEIEPDPTPVVEDAEPSEIEPSADLSDFVENGEFTDSLTCIEAIPVQLPLVYDIDPADDSFMDAYDAAAAACEELPLLVDQPEPEPEPEEAEAGTAAQQNALRSAEEYLDYTAFSRSGLIDQLEYEGFSTDDATWAVDNVTVDWDEQAAASAQQYLDYTSFSRSGLIEQLEYEGFTTEQAEYGVNQTGL